MTAKHIREMSPQEQAETLARLKRGSLPEPPPLPDGQKRAKDMSEREQQEWLSEHKRRWR
jgi:hypothetical protein